MGGGGGSGERRLPFPPSADVGYTGGADGWHGSSGKGILGGSRRVILRVKGVGAHSERGRVREGVHSKSAD